MTRTSHHAHPTSSYPVYCLEWADDDTLLMGGGGGASKSGIANKLKSCKVSRDGRKVKYTSEITLSNEEDAPMTMAVDREHKLLVTGINASQSSIEGGKNDHCRLFEYGEKFNPVKGQRTLSSDIPWSDDYPYQKITALSPTAELVAVGTTNNQVSILSFPTLEPAAEALSFDDELVDISWGGTNGEWLAATTTTAVLVYRVTKGEDGVVLKLRQSIYPPSLDISPVAFRAARFSPTMTSEATPVIHAVLNVSKVTKRGGQRKSFVVNFGVVAGPSKAPVTESEKGKEKATEEIETELGRWDLLARREVASKQVTVCDISTNGALLSYGCADLSVGILDAKTLAPLLKILHAHSFPPTALRFNPSATLLVSASPDQTIRAIVVPASFDGSPLTLIAVLIALLILIIAVLLRP